MKTRPGLKLMVLFSSLGTAFNVGAQTGNTMLILDGSGSMWGQIEGRSKIEIAREAVEELLAQDGLTGELGFMAYGHRREADCSDIEILAAPASDNRDEIRARVRDVVPRGKTPIGQSVLLAARALNYTTQPATVVLVSDGIENCGVDLCRLAETLNADGFRIVSHVIGFGLSEGEGEALECLASVTGGKNFAADDAASLVDALRETVITSAAPVDSQESGDRSQDIIVRGSDVIFLAGRDDVIVPPRGPEHDPQFVIKRHGHLQEPLMETYPPEIAVKSGEKIRILDLARGGIHFFPSAGPGWGPAGNTAGGASRIDSLGGISGYWGPQGGLLGVFLGDENPADAPPPETLNIERALLEPTATLDPEIGQVFYIGDGSIFGSKELKVFNAPEGATRMFLGIADAWGFYGAPGYYDDNDGRYTIRIGIQAANTSDSSAQVRPAKTVDRE